jgi:CYTH domain-containing protein
MPQRQFLVACAPARLIRKEQGVVGRIVEGYFPARPNRDHFVSLEPGHCYLVLAAGREGAGHEERTEVPRTQAEALMAVCAGKVGFECTIVPLRGGKQALLQRFIAPGVLDLLSVEFEEREDANGFVPPAWFGPEVTQNAAYHRGSLARVGLPAPEEIPLSNAMLNDLLDTIEEGAVAAQLGRAPSQRTPGTRSVGEHPEVSTEANSLPAPLAESVHRNGLIAGLAEALEQFQATRSAPDTEEASQRGQADMRRWG